MLVWYMVGAWQLNLKCSWTVQYQNGIVKDPFHDLVEGKLFSFTSEEDRMRILLQLVITFLLKEGGQLLVLYGSWTQVGIPAGNFNFNIRFQLESKAYILFVTKIFHDKYSTC